MRGGWYGFHRGIFNGKKRMDRRCLSSNTEDEIAGILEFIAYGEFYDVIGVADDMTSLYFDNKAYCGAQDISLLITHKCYPSDDSKKSHANPCGFMSITQNIT